MAGNSEWGTIQCSTPLIPQKSIDLDYRRLVRASKKLDSSGLSRTVRLAILSDAASQQFVPVLKTLFHENGVAAEIYEGAFDAIELETLDPASALYGFRPDVVVLATCTQALRLRYYQAGSLEGATSRVVQIWDALQHNSAAKIIQFNFPLPYDRPFGNYGLKVTQSLYPATAALNAQIAALAQERSNIFICDVESIASWCGRKYWFDERLWHLSKTFCHLEFLPLVAQTVVDIVLSTMGQIVKCVIVDLDNTLWGGTVGDDGHLGIAIGAHGDGEAFYHFQHYLLSLKHRGILLAVCSKNDRETALRPFVDNPDMVLKRDDITIFIANWENKADNIRTIRETLEIGFDSLVFLDDNPFERNLVRQMCPEVIVPELPDDPADYVRALSELNLFETAAFSAEDIARPELYRQEAERRELRSQFSNIDDYLASLEMKIEVARFEKTRIPRIAQLMQRSNQFNLTTHRYNEAECEFMMLDVEHCLPLYASLTDRLGDHGLISIVIVRPGEHELHITDWLMSCRVLTRGVEHCLMTRVVNFAKEKGLERVIGEYIPTAKNKMVQDFYAQFGFEKISEQDGRTLWRLDVNSYQPRKVYITENEYAWTQNA